MHSAIQIRTEGERGCGYRKVGGLYLCGGGPAISCGRLPVPLETCSCCGTGFKPARGWTWVDAERLIRAAAPTCDMSSNCAYCPIGQILDTGASGILGMAGLLWVGEKFYATPLEFNREAHSMGISRRISQVPTVFEVGKTWVLLAHRKAIQQPVEFGKEPEFRSGIFRIFKPDRIEIVVNGTESDATIESYLKRGLTPVLVNKVVDIEEAAPLLLPALVAEGGQ